MKKDFAKVVVTQHQHILVLLEKLKDMEKEMAENLIRIPDWGQFISSHVDPYTLKYVVRDLQHTWYDINMFDYDISFNFYKGKSIYEEDKNIRYVDIKIGIHNKGYHHAYFNSGDVGLTVNIVTEPILIDEFNEFLNKAVETKQEFL